MLIRRKSFETYTMMSRTLCLLATLVSAAYGQEWVEPDYCRTIDCPVFEIIETTPDYELRRYLPAQYVSTDFEASTIEESDALSRLVFNKLFRYIDGDNEAGVIIEMTAPVVNKIRPSSTGPAQFTQSFYIPYEYQGMAPEPTAEDVYLQDFPELVVYVSAFSGYAFSQDHIDNINSLETSLNGTAYNTEVQYWCGYDSPFQPFDRHNEGWLEALEQSSMDFKNV